MARVAKVAVDLEANSAKFTAGLAQADRALAQSGQRWQNTLAKTDGAFRSMAGSISGIFAGITAGAAVNALYTTNAEFQKLGASLKTVTGSSENAKVAFDLIKQFASETPYQLTEVTDAFIKLKALGLDASVESLRSFGNTASAMGKPLQQFIEAVADAATFEFERLKEFGIKASQQGDEVAFTFQGTTTRVKKNAEDITGYLKKIGETQFAGAMAEQMNTLGGAVSNLKDNLDSLLSVLGELGANKAMMTIISAVSELLKRAAVGAGDWAAAFGDLEHASIPVLEKIRDRLQQSIKVNEDWVKAFGGEESKQAVANVQKLIDTKLKQLGEVNAELARRSESASKAASVTAAAPRNTGPTQTEIKQQEKIKEKLKDLQFEEAQLQRNEREQFIYTNLKAADIDITSKQGQAIAEAAGRLYDKAEAVKLAADEEKKYADSLVKQNEAAMRIRDTTQQQIEDNDKLIAAMKVSEAEYERVAALLDIINQYRAAGLEMTPDEIAAAEEVAKKLGEQRVELDKLKQKNEELKELGTDVFHAIGTATEDAILKFKDMRSVLAGLLQDVAKIFLRMAITKPLEGIAGSLFSNIFGGGSAGAASGLGDWGFSTGATMFAAEGGRIVGPGGPKSDSILAALSNGEFVMNAAATQKYLPLLEALNNGHLPKFADGGLVGSTVPYLGSDKTSGDTYMIDARGADQEGLAKLERMIMKLNGSIEHRSVAAVAAAASRGGKTAHAIRGGKS